MIRRRPLVLAAAASALAAVVPASTLAQRASGAASPLRCGVDLALMASGLASALRLGFGRDTGIGVLLVPGPALAVLEAAQSGESDAALCNAPEAEAALEQQGLLYDRHRLALGDFVLVGPAAASRAKTPLFPAGSAAVDALARLREKANAEPGSVAFLSAGDGSGTHLAEQRLWRAAHIAPTAPWYVAADAGRDFLVQLRERQAWALVERGAWMAHGGGASRAGQKGLTGPAGPTGLAIAVEGDAGLIEEVHAMRSFHGAHPVGKIFIAWVGGRRGRAIAASHRGYRGAA